MESQHNPNSATKQFYVMAYLQFPHDDFSQYEAIDAGQTASNLRTTNPVWMQIAYLIRTKSNDNLPTLPPFFYQISATKPVLGSHIPHARLDLLVNGESSLHLARQALIDSFKSGNLQAAWAVYYQIIGGSLIAVSHDHLHPDPEDDARDMEAMIRKFGI